MNDIMAQAQEHRAGKQWVKALKIYRLVLEAVNQLTLASAEELALADSGTRPRLETLLDSLGQGLRDTSSALSTTYFTHAERPYQLVEEEP